MRPASPLNRDDTMKDMDEGMNGMQRLIDERCK